MEKSTVLVVDAGNTSIKIGVFKGHQLVSMIRLKESELTNWLDQHEFDQGVPCTFSSVSSPEIQTLFEKRFSHVIVVSKNSVLPLNLNYSTPETLGLDRICNAAALAVLNPGKPSVSIDLGTCIKFDFVDQYGQYQGGSISPGLTLRYKALNDYTSNLPLLDAHSHADLIGKSTFSSIHSGVYNGMYREILGMIAAYEAEFSGLTFFMTGGDAQYFDFSGKNNIFADENLTLKGLYHIYLLNAQ